MRNRQLINNPTREFVVDYPLAKVMESFENVGSIDSKLKVAEVNEVMNSILIKRKASLDLIDGNNFDVRVSKITDTQTKINIEASRSVGGFDKSWEVQDCMAYMKDITDAFSTLLAYDNLDDALLSLAQAEKERQDKKAKAQAEFNDKYGNTVKWVINVVAVIFISAIAWWMFSDLY